MGYLVSGLNQLGAIIFAGISWAINQFYAMILSLSNIDLFSNFSEIKNKIFMLMGLFMLFKLALSVIQYVINPDKLNDSSIGAQKILIKVVVVLALLGSVDAIFEEATRIQNIIIDQSILENLVFGKSGSGVDEKLDEEGLSKDKKGRYLSFAIFAPFIKFNPEAFDDQVDICEETPFLKRAAVGPYGEVDFSGDCYDLLAPLLTNQDKFEEDIKDLNLRKAIFKTFKAVRDYESAFDIDIFIGTIVGMVCLITLVVICVNVAIRTIKLSFLRLIAPIPIISYIDPNDKDGMFKKWLKLTINTYLDLFIRLLAFYFAIYIITNIIAKDKLGNYTFLDHPLLYTFFLIGTLLFAMQLPKIITDLTGINTDGLSKGIKKGGSMLGSALLGGGIGMATGIAAGLNRIGSTSGDREKVRALMDKKNNGTITADEEDQLKNLRHNIRGTTFSALGGMITGQPSAFVRSAWAARNGGNIITNARTGVTATGVTRNANWARDLSGNRVRSSIPLVSPVLNTFGEMAGLKNTTFGQAQLKADKKQLTEQITADNYSLQDFVTQRSEAVSQRNDLQIQRTQLQGEISALNDQYSIFKNLLGFNGDIDFENSTQLKKMISDSIKNLNNNKSSYSTQSFNDLTNALNSMNISFGKIDHVNTEISDLNTKVISRLDGNISNLRSKIDKDKKSLDATEKKLDNLNKANKLG